MRLHVSLREVWLAISASKRTMMLSAVPLSVAVPSPAREHKEHSVMLEVGYPDNQMAGDFWIAVSEERTKARQ